MLMAQLELYFNSILVNTLRARSLWCLGQCHVVITLVGLDNEDVQSQAFAGLCEAALELS